MSTMVGYAYLDKHGFMHVVSSEKDAKEYAKLNGKVKRYEGVFRGGYPLHEGNEVIVRLEGGEASTILATYKGDRALAKGDEAAFVEFALGLV